MVATASPADLTGDYTGSRWHHPTGHQDRGSLAREVEAVLQSEQATDYFQGMYGNQPDSWSEAGRA